MGTYLVAIGLIFAILLAGIGVDRLYRRFAARNPQLGPFRKAGRGCGSCSGASGCSSKKSCNA
jgi:hypothetical protein